MEPEKDYNKMKLSDLQKELRGRGLSTKGLKGELIQRLQEGGTGPSSTEPSTKRTASSMGTDAPVYMETQPAQPKQPRINEPSALQEATDGLLQTAADVAADAASPAPKPVIRIDDDNEVSFVKIYNSYAIKDKCRAAGFKFDSDERAWIQPLKVLMQTMGVLDKDNVTEEMIMELVQNAEPQAATAAEKVELQPGEGLKVEVSEDKTVLVKGEGTYSSKEHLRAVGFRWDRDATAWTRPLEQVEEQLRGEGAGNWDGEEEFAEAVVEMVKRGSSEGGRQEAGERPAPELVIEGEMVLVRNSYDIKDHLRGLGFSFMKEQRSWGARVEHCLGLSAEFASAESLTLPALMALDPTALNVQAEAAKPPPSLKFEEGDVLVSNSYAIKDQLRALGFRWDQERVVWRKNAAEVMEQVGVGDEEELTVEALTSVGKSLEESGGGGGGEAAAVVKTVDGEVRVYNSYSERETLRGLGFRWNAAEGCWGKALEELRGMEGAEALGEVGPEGEGLSMEALRMVPAQSWGEVNREGRAAHMTEEDGAVMVWQSWEVREQCRRAGLRWEAERGCWAGSAEELRERLGVGEGELTLQRILEWDGGGAEGQGGGGARVELVGDEVLVHNSYAEKDRLRALEFRWDSERRVWAKAMVEVKERLGLEDQADITLDKILALAPPAPAGEDMAAQPSAYSAHAQPEQVRSPSPLPQDETPGEHLLSEMGRSLQGWSQASAAQST